MNSSMYAPDLSFGLSWNEESGEFEEVRLGVEEHLSLQENLWYQMMDSDSKRDVPRLYKPSQDTVEFIKIAQLQSKSRDGHITLFLIFLMLTFLLISIITTI